VLARHVGLPVEACAGAVIALEKVRELSVRLSAVAQAGPGPRQLLNAATSLDRLAVSFGTYVRETFGVQDAGCNAQ
jgi:hypothetical protein